MELGQCDFSGIHTGMLNCAQTCDIPHSHTPLLYNWAHMDSSAGLCLERPIRSTTFGPALRRALQNILQCYSPVYIVRALKRVLQGWDAKAARYLAGGVDLVAVVGWGAVCGHSYPMTKHTVEFCD